MVPSKYVYSVVLGARGVHKNVVIDFVSDTLFPNYVCQDHLENQSELLLRFSNSDTIPYLATGNYYMYSVTLRFVLYRINVISFKGNKKQSFATFLRIPSDKNNLDFIERSIVSLTSCLNNQCFSSRDSSFDIVNSSDYQSAIKRGFTNFEVKLIERGGSRPGAGRPKVNSEATKAIRVPVSTVSVIESVPQLKELLNDWESRPDKPNSPRWKHCIELIREIKELINA